MKQFLQITLVAGGWIGMLLFVLPAISVCIPHLKSSTSLSDDERIILFRPLLALVSVLLGWLWIRISRRKEPRRSPGQFTEDGTAAF